MPIKEAEFNKFIDKAQGEFKAFEQKVDGGLESIYKLLNAGVETITTYLTGDFTTALRHQMNARIKTNYAGDAAMDNRNHAISLISELYAGIDKQTDNLRTELIETYNEISQKLSENLSPLGLDEYFSEQIFQTLEMICPKYRLTHLDAKKDLRKRGNWGPIIKVLKTKKLITD